MKICIDRDTLNDAVSWAARALPSRPPTPILSGLFLKAEAGSLGISSFDYETSAHLQIEVEVEEPGEIVVSGRLLADICKSFPSYPVKIATEGEKIDLTCRSSRFTLMSMPRSEYPELPDFPKIAGSVEGEVFARAVAQVGIAASRDDTLPIMTGIKMEFDGETLTLLATDRYRLAMRELNWRPSDPNFSAAALLKAKVLGDLSKALTNSGEIHLAFSEDSSLVGFESVQRRTTSLLIDGEYPKIRSLFPETTPIHAVVEKNLLNEAVRRVSLVAERNTPVRLRFTQGQVELDAGTSEEAQASERLESSLQGEDLTVAFNPQYLSEGLSALESQYVRFSFTSAAKPAMLTAQESSDGGDNDEYRYLLMPVRLSN